MHPAQALTPVLLKTLTALNRSVLPVVADARLVGLVTRRDLIAAGRARASVTVGSIMRREYARVEAEADLSRAQQLMFGAGQDVLPVVDGDRLQGMLTAADIRAACVAPRVPILGETPQLISPEAPSL